MALAAVFALLALAGLFLILADAGGRMSSPAPSMYRSDLGFIGWVIFLVCALLAASAYLTFAPARGAELCPAERPIYKVVATGYVTCTAVACIGKLYCPGPDEPPGVGMPRGACYRLPAESCNTCTQEMAPICLTQQEYEEAQRK